jgi:hypothetical protein
MSVSFDLLGWACLVRDRFCLDAQQNWSFLLAPFFASACASAAIFWRAWIHTGIGIGSHEKDRRILLPRFHVVIRRIRINEIELLGIFRGAVFGDPEFCDLEILVTQHVE